MYVGPPDIDSITEIFNLELAKLGGNGSYDTEQISGKRLAAHPMIVKHQNYLSGAELSAVCREAALLTIERAAAAGGGVSGVENARIGWAEFDAALNKVCSKPRITHEMIQFYADYQKQSGLTVI